MPENNIQSTSLSSLESQCLVQVSNFVSSLLLSASRQEEHYVFNIDHVHRLKSAQQHVLLLTVRLKQLPNNACFETDAGKHDDQSNDQLQLLKDSIKRGHGKIVLRIWKNGAKWWNLNLKQTCGVDCNDNPEEIAKKRQYETQFLCHNLAKAEIAGYKVAKRGIEYYNHLRNEENFDNQWVETNVCIPCVIHFHCATIHHQDNSYPWALLSYVGNESDYVKNLNMSTVKGVDGCDVGEPLIVCEKFVQNMVKVRHEFGFDEPHPRHGRVNTEQALSYALHVMDTVILPIHVAFFHSHNKIMREKESQNSSSFLNQKHILLDQDGSDLVFVNYYLSGILEPSSAFPAHEVKPCRYDDMVHLYSVIMSDLENQMVLNKVTKEGNDRFTAFFTTLRKCVTTLQSEWDNSSCDVKGRKLTPVLCHLDLQPQNMILFRKSYSDVLNEVPNILSVLDWEESCFADPRFELLLLCRKVVATRNQADFLWHTYDEKMRTFFKVSNNNTIIGSIEPWLKLETVHSLITLFMQGMDVGGRSPWEGSQDLFNKMSREMKRLGDLGWKFCNESCIP